MTKEAVVISISLTINIKRNMFHIIYRRSQAFKQKNMDVHAAMVTGISAAINHI
jgi:hypothetical protein